MEDDLKKKNGRGPQKKHKEKLKTRMTASKKMEDDLNKNGKRPKQKWKTNQSTKINLIGCDTIVNSPSFEYNRNEGLHAHHLCQG